MDDYKAYPGHKIFPIKTKTACMLKWAWSTINIANKKTSSCHRVDKNSFDPDNLANFHNLPEKIQAREAMLSGEWPGHGCEYCKRVEEVGGTSDRQMTLMRSHGADKVPPELYINPMATAVTPTILEIYFNNTCNLACMYCMPSVSSKWNDDISKYGSIKIEDFSMSGYTCPSNNEEYNKMVADLWNYLTENERYKTIRHYHLLGGESLLQKELNQSLDFWQAHPNPALTFNIISNLMIPHHLFVKKMSKFTELVDTNSIYKLELTASIDCLGPQQEYVRWGLKLDTFIENFEYMLDKPWASLAVHTCITSLTIKTMPALIDKINQWNKLRPIDLPINFSFDVVVGEHMKNSGMHPAIFGDNFFADDFAKIIEVMPEHTDDQRSVKAQMIGTADYINKSPINHNRINILIQYLDELDRRRGTTWQDLFPWLLQFQPNTTQVNS